MKYIKVLFVVTIVFLSSFLVVGCKDENRNFITETVKYASVETPYGVLEYPENIGDKIIVKQETEQTKETNGKNETNVKNETKETNVKNEKKEKNHSVDFYGKVDGKEILLYQVNYGESNGDYIGDLTTGTETVKVYVKFFNLDTTNLTESQKLELYAAQESVNDVITALSANPNFKSK